MRVQQGADDPRMWRDSMSRAQQNEEEGGAESSHLR